MISNYDENYETTKNEFYNLYNNVLNINDSLNHHNNTIIDLYLNENSTLNLLSRYYSYNQNEHPIGQHSNSLLFQFKNTFDSWNRDQQIQFQTINRYISQLDGIKNKIERLEVSTNPNDLARLKNEVFKDVQQQFDNRVNQFDIPVVNIQNSFHSLIQSLNLNLNDSLALLQKPINFISPVSHLKNNQQPHHNNNLVRNTLPQISKPTPSRMYTQPQVYSPPTQSAYSPPTQSAYSPPTQSAYSPPTQSAYSPPSQPQQNNPYQQYYPPQQPQQPQQPEKKTVKSSLRQIERPAPVELPETTFIEPELKRKPGDFLKDPKAPRYVPERVEPSSKKSDTLAHHNMSLSESRAYAMAHKPAPLPPPPTLHR